MGMRLCSGIVLFLASMFCLRMAVAQSDTNTAGEHWEGMIRQGSGHETFFRMNFESPTRGTLEILGQKIPIEIERRDASHVEIRTKDEKPSVFSGEQNGDRVTGLIADERGPAQFWMELEPALPHPRDHAEAWAQDLAYADRKLPKMDRSFTPPMRERFHRTVTELEANVRSLDYISWWA